MSLHAIQQRTIVTSGGINPHDIFHVIDRHGHIVATGDPVLRAGVMVTQQLGRQLGDDVVGVGDAVVVALVGDVFGQSEVADAGLAVVVLFIVNISAEG